MARSSIFGSPMLVGFEPFERMLEQMSKASSDGYPPYNIEQLNERQFRISLAVAGFGPEELSVVVDDSRLTISGHHREDGQQSFLHRGIATRQFQRSFLLANGLEISGSWLDNGMLHIDIVRLDPGTRVRQIEIRSSPKNGSQ
ncbi:MAG: Hsp20 family protein [Alphaproteobacteria bacterium]